MTDEVFEAWIEDCKKKIRDLQSMDLAQSGSFNAVLSQYLTPFHYFKMDWAKTMRPSGPSPSPFGSESIAAQQSGGGGAAPPSSRGGGGVVPRARGRGVSDSEGGVVCPPQM